MQALKIDAICYTSELDRDQREKAVGEFTKNPNSAMVFIGGFFVGAAGLNLQASAPLGYSLILLRIRVSPTRQLVVCVA